MAEHWEVPIHGFAEEKGRKGKGALSVFLFVTDKARSEGLPLDPSDLVTDGGGQVRGLGVRAVQNILARHDIQAVLAKEGGRTSRNSPRNMKAYVRLLNRLDREAPVDLDRVEEFWIGRVRLFLAGKPFKLRLDARSSLRSVVQDLVLQAERKQQKAPGRTDVGAVLQHLVGAKLERAMGRGRLVHHSYSTADAATARRGDFEVGDTVVHVTAAPSESVIRECRANLEAGRHPVLVTLSSRMPVALGLSDQAGLAGRLDVFDIEQFLGLNIYEWTEFRSENRRSLLRKFVKCYNQIVGEVETDPSLRIEVK